MSNTPPAARPSPFLIGLLCRCPRCGKGKLFSGFLKVAPRCTVCGLDLKFADSGDGPAIFIIFAVSPIILILAFITEALFHPAPYVHLLLWIPTTLILCLALLRPFKATMVVLQYRHDAHEGHQ
ncbi:MAG TPA: DUF983 domain-containing protein [Devosiaceae bacterium]|jgi:uncharacterized protein (DUF983 family)